MKYTTGELLDILKTKNNIEDFFENFSEEFSTISITDYIDDLLEYHAISKTQVVKLSGLDRTYAYQIMNGTRQGSRDKIIALALAIGCSGNELSTLLKLSGLAILYPRIQRDSCIIFAVENHKSVQELNELLESMGQELLNI